MARTSKFTETEQQATVKGWINSNETAAAVASRLNISVATLYLWKQKYLPASPVQEAANVAELQAQIDNLRLSNTRLRNLLRAARAAVSKEVWDSIAVAYSRQANGEKSN